jgi:hypothetical protein
MSRKSSKADSLLGELNAEAAELAQTIQQNFEELGI